MFNRKIHTPEGVQDTLFEECKFKRNYENIIMNVFESCGYFEIETPTYEFYDVFEGLDGIEQESCFKFFDREGRILTLRSDLTTPISRVVATKISSNELPLKVSYLGNAFRYEDVQKGGRQREFTQAGIELFGDSSYEADAEIIITAIKAITALGIDDFKLDIGQINFFKGLISEAGIDNKTGNKIQECINFKDTFMLKELLKSLQVNEDVKETLLILPNMFGDIEIVDELLKTDINDTSKNALVNIKEVYDIIREYGYEKYISVDLGLLQSIKYYTGIVFKGFTYGVGFPICGGGRYDTLSSRFGKEISATGCAISISRLVSSQLFKNEKMDKIVCDATVFFDKASRKNAIFIAESLRIKGMSVELKLKSDEENDLDYLKRKGISNGIFVCDNDIMVHNLAENKVYNTNINELLSGGEIK